MRPFVELEGVAVDYGPVRVLDGINLTVDPGDFLGIIGPNGSGKTTLLRVMLGLLPPTEGAVRLFGKPPAAFREWGRLGYVPQKTTLDPAQLPIDASGFQVDEAKVDVVASGKDLDPKASETVTANNLQAGSYVLFCNIPSHYQSGMHVLFAVQ